MDSRKYGATELRSIRTLHYSRPFTGGVLKVPGSTILNIEKGQWHSLKCLESGTVLFEAKDGKYEPLEKDIME